MVFVLGKTSSRSSRVPKSAHNLSLNLRSTFSLRQRISYVNCRLLQRNDGYHYALQERRFLLGFNAEVSAPKIRSGTRKPYGGTRSHGFKRGSLVKHLKLGLVYIGGILQDRISLHNLETGKRITQQAKPTDCHFLTYSSWRTRLLPGLKAEVSAA